MTGRVTELHSVEFEVVVEEADSVEQGFGKIDTMDCCCPNLIFAVVGTVLVILLVASGFVGYMKWYHSIVAVVVGRVTELHSVELEVVEAAESGIVLVLHFAALVLPFVAHKSRIALVSTDHL